MTPNKMESVEETVTQGFESLLPERAQDILSGATDWIKDHPTEAALIGAAGGLLVGLTGFGRIYAGVKAIRSMPIVSQLLMGAVAQGFAAKRTGRSVH